MDVRAADWFARRTSSSDDWPLEALLHAKAATRVSVVLPARNEESTIAEVVSRIRADLAGTLVDELVVIDSLSSDATAAKARAAGVVVHSVADIRPDLGISAGKGEALWKSLFVTSGDVLVFIDSDLTEWGTHFVTGLLGPLLSDPTTLLVKGFYDRVADLDGVQSTEGGRVTELVARPLISLRFPELAGVVQPLAGEWAVRRSLFAEIPVPVGYGVEFATLLATLDRGGLEAIAQVDLGRRAHRHQSVHDLGVMATEILAVADGFEGAATLAQPDRTAPDSWRQREVPTAVRPPANSVPAGDPRC
jgi:glucosyl-3-phosphoglycerate synthase